MRRTHVHVSDGGSVRIIHEDPYNMDKSEDSQKEESSTTADIPSAPNIHVVLHTEGQEDETINLDDAQKERNKDNQTSEK